MTPDNLRILIADDLPAIHDDYRKILALPTTTAALVQGVADFAPHFARPATVSRPFLIESVLQGEDAIVAVAEAKARGNPFAMIFLDVRMPPGIDGIETAQRLRIADPDLQIVICTAYSDYPFMEISRRFRESDGLLILKKPFDPAEVQQLAHALCRKWTLSAENKALVGNLEGIVRQRTAELEHTQSELKVALRKAEVASDSKSDFLRCVSHELNTPLNGIMGAASVIELSTDPEAAEMGKLMLQSTERLHRLFSRILLYLSLDGQAPSKSQPVSLAAVIEKSLTPHRAQAAAKDILLTSENKCPATLWLAGSAEELTQALTSLVENAVKFTHFGHIHVSLSCAANGDFVCEVQDSGPGIYEPQLSQLYELFSPGDVKLTRRHQGIGISLTLAKRIAEHFGGILAHRNRETAGSVFTLTLPCKPPPTKERR